MIRVGIVFSPDDAWLGGVNYFINLVKAVYSLPARKIEIVILTSAFTTPEKLSDFPDIEVIRSRIFDRYFLPWVIRKLWQRIFSRDLFLEKFLQKHQINVLSHSGWLGRSARIPTIGWIPDFQHIHLPDFFSKNELLNRDRQFKAISNRCTKIIVSSNDALKDLRAFAPEKIEKYEVLSFAAPPADENGNLPTIDDLKAKYLFSGSFFLLPNQFWVHKNHQVVVKALGYLKQQGSPVLVIATGNTQDSRQPGHFKGLMQEVTALAVEDCFKVLGIVPKADLATLMKYAIAVINPSLFEGWSTTVEEAKAFYKPIILSDIAVHREQNPLLATYFSPGNASELAKKLWQIWNQPEENMKKTIELTLYENNKRRFEFARKYQEIVLKTLKQ